MLVVKHVKLFRPFISLRNLNFRHFATLKDIDPSKNYYNILNVEKEASVDEVRRSYYFLAKNYHPDVIKNMEFMDELQKKQMNTQYLEISEAYEILNDPELKSHYDNVILAPKPKETHRKRTQGKMKSQSEDMKSKVTKQSKFKFVRYLQTLKRTNRKVYYFFWFYCVACTVGFIYVTKGMKDYNLVTKTFKKT